jgi:putative peptidoglycan lipid II flippase
VKLFQSGFYALRDTRTPVKIASASLLLSSLLAYVLMRRFGAPGIALGSSLGATVNVVLHLRDLDARIGAILGGLEWRAFGVSLVASAAAAIAGLETAKLAGGGGAGPLISAAAALGIFGLVYFAGTLALRHPDARRLWTFLS